MQHGALMPLVVSSWYRSRYHCVEGQATLYILTIEMFCGLIYGNVITQYTVDLNVDVWCIELWMLYDTVIKEDIIYLDDDIWSIVLLLMYDDLDVNFILNIDGSV